MDTYVRVHWCVKQFLYGSGSFMTLPSPEDLPWVAKESQWCFMKTMETLTTLLYHMQRHTRALCTSLEQDNVASLLCVKWKSIIFKAHNFAQRILNTKILKNLHFLNVLNGEVGRRLNSYSCSNLSRFKSHASMHEFILL